MQTYPGNSPLCAMMNKKGNYHIFTAWYSKAVKIGQLGLRVVNNHGGENVSEKLLLHLNIHRENISNVYKI